MKLGKFWELLALLIEIEAKISIGGMVDDW